MRTYAWVAMTIMALGCEVPGEPDTQQPASEYVDVFYRGEPAVAKRKGEYWVVDGDILALPSEVERADACSGDICSRDQQLLRRNGISYRWGQGDKRAGDTYRIEYSLQSLVGTKHSQVRDAMSWWTSANPAIAFAEVDDCGLFDDCIEFMDDDESCSSFVGRMSGFYQIINVAGWCQTGNIAHEIGHALGLYHEQQRNDRDSYVTVNSSDDTNYGKVGNDGFEFGEYDYDSIMHYGRSAELSAPTGVAIGQRTHLSKTDIAGIKAMYPTLRTVDVVFFPAEDLRLAELVGREFLPVAGPDVLSNEASCLLQSGGAFYQDDGFDYDSSTMAVLDPLAYGDTWRLYCTIRSNFWQRRSENSEYFNDSKPVKLLSSGLLPLLFM